MDIKKNWSLWLAVIVPLAMIVFVAGSIYLPRLWAPSPAYGFVYAVSDTAASGYMIPQYAMHVVNGKLTKEVTAKSEMIPADVKLQQYVEPHLYRYDIATGESTNITFEEAEKLKLDDRQKSPDNFEVSQGGNYSGPFGGGSEPALYMTGHSVSQKLDLRGVTHPYDFEFIGWVTQ